MESFFESRDAATATRTSCPSRLGRLEAEHLPPSVRTPRRHGPLDPDVYSGYLRAVTGDLNMTTDQWLGDDGTDTKSTRPHWRLRHAGLQHGSGRQLVPDGLHAQRRRHQPTS